MSPTPKMIRDRSGDITKMSIELHPGRTVARLHPILISVLLLLGPAPLLPPTTQVGFQVILMAIANQTKLKVTALIF